MSAIGGIMELKKYDVDASILDGMRKTMCLRGGTRSAAFLYGGVGMLWSGEPGGNFSPQPNICERGGRTSAVCIDAADVNSNAVFEKYFVRGVEFLGELIGGFALSLYDGEKNMLILARDKKGRKPLFYKVFGNTVYFASEIKGILDVLGEHPVVDRSVLCMHITSPMGIYKASDIYIDIEEVLPGECVIFTRMGMSKFFYRECVGVRKLAVEHTFRNNERVCTPYATIDTVNLNDYLNEALLAFDMPQFDAFMPSLMELLDNATKIGKRFVGFEDCVRRRNITYSYEREDRLGALYGIRCIGIIPHNRRDGCEEYALRQMETKLYERFSEIGNTGFLFLQNIFGRVCFDALQRELEVSYKKDEEAEVNIRILGMLCQTVDWAESRQLLIKENEFLCQYS